MATTTRFCVRSVVPAPAEALWAWHARPAGFARLVPPWTRVRVIEAGGGPPADGMRMSLLVSLAGCRRRWDAVLTDVRPGIGFTDVQQRGPFAHWTHVHRFVPIGARESRLEDTIDYALPGGRAGRMALGGIARREIERAFAYRHAITIGDLERHARVADRPALHVAISGASGLVGSALAAFLEAGGHRVSRLVRRAARAPGEIAYDPAAGTIEHDKLVGLDAVVNLAGESIAAARWSAEQRARIRDSRERSARTIALALARGGGRPRVLVSASASGFYGDRGDQELDEDSGSGDGFLAEVCRAWEAAVAPAESAGVRVVRLRLGVVLTPAGGALARMLIPFRLGVGGRVGSGAQFMSWIAHDDVVGVIHHALFDDGLAGPVNAVAPAAVTNAELTRVLGRVLRRPTALPVPAAAIRLLLGAMGQELLLASARLRPARLARAGFAFRHPDLESALRFELGRERDTQ